MHPVKRGAGNVPVPFAQALDFSGHWTYDAAKRQYTLEVVPTPAATNERGTVHGGYLSAALDVTAERLVLMLEDVPAAVTLTATYFFLHATRPNCPLTVTVSVAAASGDVLHIDGYVATATRLVALMKSQWTIRRNRR